MHALNDFEYALFLTQSGQYLKGKITFENSAKAFRKAFSLLCAKDDSNAGAALKYQALACSYLGQTSADMQTIKILEELMEIHPHQWHAMDSPDEILYLHGFFTARLAKPGENEKFFAIAERSLKAAILHPAGKFADQALRHLGAMHYSNGNYAEAEAAYLQLANDYPKSPFAGEAWYWSACCADNLKEDAEIGRQRRRYVFENFPHSPIAAEAYFTLYTYQEYLQGNRNAIKHLQNFSIKYPQTPFLIESKYLIGLDYKRDRKTPEGKWIRKKSFTDSIDAFQEAENLFDTLKASALIPEDKLDYYIAVRYRATLERALANLAIAEDSQGAKRQIYLEYAEEVFKNLVADFCTPDHPEASVLCQGNPYPSIYEESSFWLAQTYIKAQDDAAAEQVLSDMLNHYQQAKVTRGYYLSRVWYEQAKIAIRNKDFALALQFLKHAEDSSKGHLLSTDQKLDLWIQQSLCYRGLDQFDNAILVLSRVVNDDAISALRLKAMYLRAETYELQGRPELARKQLESMAKKGGVWALKAQEKMEKEYGY